MQHDPINQPPEPQAYNVALPLFNPGARPRLLRPLAWRILVTILVLLALTVIGLIAGSTRLEGAPSAHPVAKPAMRPVTFDPGAPLVMAFYYSWFDDNTWTYDRLSDLPSETYVSRDRGAMGRHIDQAKNAGIDAFLLAWYGPAGGNNQTEANLSAMLDEAAARGFKIGILFETDGPFFGGVGDVTAALQHAQNTHFNHPAYLRVDGRPVVYFWRPTVYGVDTWRNIRAQSDPGYTNIWISEGVNTGYLDVFDGHHLYSNTWNPPADLHAVNRRYGGEVAAARDRLGAYKFWAATVMPGYDDVRIRAGGAGFAQDRQGGAYYSRAWEAAMASNPNWIVINSFNEWPEGSYIEPSVAHGDHYINLTRELGSRFKSGGGVSVALAPPVPPALTPEPDSPTAFVEAAMLNLRAGPSVDFPVLTQLRQGAALPITGRHPTAEEWWQVQIDSQTGWVHREFVTSAGPLEQVGILDEAALPTLPSPPAATETPEDEAAVLAASMTADIATDIDRDIVVESAAAEITKENTEEDIEEDIEAAAPAAVSEVAGVAGIVQAGARAGNGDDGQSPGDPMPETVLDSIALESALSALSQAIRTAVHPIPNPAQETLHPYLSR